jgi:cytochrome c-type biogenesis protein CcmH
MRRALHRWLAGLAVVAVALAVSAVVMFASSDSRRGRASDKALESALLAPCCFNGTLITHESDLAHRLRDEIETRYAAGETTEAIEADMVARYTERVRAMPNERAFTMAPAFAAFVAVLGIAMLGFFVRRWRREGRIVPSVPVPMRSGPRDDYDDRIDAELLDAAD